MMIKTGPFKSVYFLMEIIIVILFFALSTTVCLSFIVHAHEQSEHAQDIRIAMREGSTLLETMQANKHIPASSVFIENDKSYTIDIEKEDLVAGVQRGTLRISFEDTILLSLPFAIEEVAQ